MGKPTSDKVQAETFTPIVINPTGVDTYNDAAALPPDKLSQADNIILDHGIIEKASGTTKGNSDSVANPVVGLHRSYSPAGTKVCLRMANGYLKSGPTAFSTSVLSSLATNKVTPWIDVRGKCYGVNETDGILRYDPSNGAGYKVGVVGPYLKKKICYFEADEGTISGTNAARVYGIYRADELTGTSKASMRLNMAGPGSFGDGQLNIPVNLSVFDNGKSVTNDDYITFYTYHTNRAMLSAMKVNFYTRGTTSAHSYTHPLPLEDLAKGDYRWTKWNLRVGSFGTLAGTPNWAKVSAVICYAKSISTNIGVEVYYDNMYLKSTPPWGEEMRKKVQNFEGAGESLTIERGGYYDYTQKYEGSRSFRLSGAAAQLSASFVIPTTNFEKWDNKTATSTGDEFVFHFRTDAIGTVADSNPLVVFWTSPGGGYYNKSFSRYSAMGLTGNDKWVECRIPRARCSATGGGSPKWSAISNMGYITATWAASKSLWIDDVYYEQKLLTSQLASFETNESWVITGYGEIVEDPQGKGWVTQGERCLKLWGQKGGTYNESYAIYDHATLDLTHTLDGMLSDDDDEISFTLYHQNVAKIEKVRLIFDNNSVAVFSNYFEYTVTKEEFAGGGKKNKMGKEIRIPKSKFTRFGSAGGWSTIGATMFVVSSKGGKNQGAVYIDNLCLRRKTGVTGRYYYKYLFKIDDICSACSEVSEAVNSQGSKVTVGNVQVSQDSRVTARELYRLGGSYPDTWGLVKIIGNNTDTVVVDDMDDDEIDTFLDDDVPLGETNSILARNLAYDASNDQMYYWGDPTWKNRVYFSHKAFYHVVDQWGYREFPDDVMYVQPWFGQIIIFYRHTIQKIVGGDITTGELVDIPSEVGSASYYSVGKPYNGMIPFVGLDNVYLFDGVRCAPIGDPIKNYFQGREAYMQYIGMATVRDALYISCMDKTGTPTYNDTVLRYYFPKKSWTVFPDWNALVWSNWEKQDDNNELYYGDSVNGDIYSINAATYQFGSSNIAAAFATGWLSFPDTDIAVHRIELKARGTASSTITFNGYANLGSSPVTTGSITLTTSWQTFRLGPKGIHELLRGNNVKLGFSQSGQNAYFNIKDIIVYAEKLPERLAITSANEISCGAP